MSNEDIANALFVDEDDLTTVATQNELFKLLGVTDGDPRYSDVLLIADWHERKTATKVREARIDELEQVYPQLQKHHGVSGEGNYYYDDRIAELKAQQEEV